MSRRLAGAKIAVEAVVALVFLVASQSANGDRQRHHLVVGFSIGYLYRHSRVVFGCRRAREGPIRTLSLALGWLAVSVAVVRSLGNESDRRRVGAGVALGSIGYRTVYSGD